LVLNLTIKPINVITQQMQKIRRTVDGTVAIRDVEVVEYFLLPLPAPLEVSCFQVRFRFLILGIFASGSG